MLTAKMPGPFSTVVLLAAATLFSPIQSKATGLSISLDTTNLTTVEGSGVCSSSLHGCASLIVDFTVTNNTGSTVAPIQFFGGGPVFVSGDPTDSFVTAFLTNNNCGTAFLASGSACTESITYVTAPDTGEVDNDFAVSQASFAVNPACDVGSCVTYSMTVNDAPVATPEPSSLILLGSGLIGIFGARRKFLR